MSAPPLALAFLEAEVIGCLADGAVFVDLGMPVDFAARLLVWAKLGEKVRADLSHWRRPLSELSPGELGTLAATCEHDAEDGPVIIPGRLLRELLERELGR